jgi:hypothetical protein
MEVHSYRRFLRMPLILAEPSYVESLRQGAGLRALRRVGILSRLNRVVEIGLDTILSGMLKNTCAFFWQYLVNLLYLLSY